MIGTVHSSSVEESDEDVDLFSDDVDPASMHSQTIRHQRAELARLEKLAHLPPPSQRTCAQNRMAYVLSRQRLQPTETAGVFNAQECERVIAAVVAFVQSQGGLHTERHEAFATTDVPVSSLTLPWNQSPPSAGLATGDVVRRCILERVLAPLAEATGFQPHHLGLKDLFVVCYRAPQSIAAQKAIEYPIPSKQASLALHSDGCLLSFSLLLNHQDAFQGGGTFFKGTGQTHHTEQGGLLVHDAGLEHAGAEVISGQRIMLIGFVETIDVLKEKMLWEQQSRASTANHIDNALPNGHAHTATIITSWCQRSRPIPATTKALSGLAGRAGLANELLQSSP